MVMESAKRTKFKEQLVGHSHVQMDKIHNCDVAIRLNIPILATKISSQQVKRSTSTMVKTRNKVRGMQQRSVHA